MPTGKFDINELKRRMQGATQSLKHELGGLRTGRAAASMLEPVQVVPTAPAIEPACDHQRARAAPSFAQVWDKSMVKAVERRSSINLGLSPATEGQCQSG
jgi:ribosome recycling factor